MTRNNLERVKNVVTPRFNENIARNKIEVFTLKIQRLNTVFYNFFYKIQILKIENNFNKFVPCHISVSNALLMASFISEAGCLSIQFI